MKAYELTVYAGETRPPDVDEVERFVIRPEDPWFGAAEQEVARRSLRGELPASWDCWIVMRAAGAPVSTAWLHLADDCLHTGLLGYVQTDPAHRGRGLGETVCRKATELAREDGRLVQPRVNSTGKSLLVRADRDGNALFVLVNEGNQVQGLASVVGTPTGEDGGTLLQLCVHPACREGALPLAARAVDWAHDQGMTGLLSYTGPLDAIAREYLATCGFEPAGTVPSDTSIEKWTRPR